MSNKKKKYAQETDKRRPSPQEARKYMLITWLCTAAVGIMVFGRAGATGTPPTALHYVLLGILVFVSLAMTEGYFRAGRASAKDEPEGRRSKG